MKVTHNSPSIFVSLGTVLAMAGSVVAQNQNETQPVNSPRAIDSPSRIDHPSETDSLVSAPRHHGVTDSADVRLWQASRSLAATRSGSAPDVLDPAFDIYANPKLIGKAYGANDSAMLTDVALQLAEGERVLLRRRNAISAKQALQLAIQAASQQQDTGSLQRIAKFSELSGDKDLAAQIAAAMKLAAVSRDATAKMMVPIETVDVEDYARMRHYSKKIESARLLSDSRSLDALELDLDGCIPDPFRDAFRKRIGEAMSEIPANHTVDDQLIGTLGMLEAMSRQTDDETEPADVPVPVTGSF